MGFNITRAPVRCKSVAVAAVLPILITMSPMQLLSSIWKRIDTLGSPLALPHDKSHASKHAFHKTPPAGIMFGHMLDNKGDFMVGYRFMLNKTNGQMQQGTHAVIDQTIIDQGCSDTIPCRFTPTHMNMHMHMIDIMYAPTKWLNVMLMPTFMDMNNEPRNLFKLDGTVPAAPPGSHSHSGIGGHETGAIGDTYLSALVKLFQIPAIVRISISALVHPLAELTSSNGAPIASIPV